MCLIKFIHRHESLWLAVFGYCHRFFFFGVFSVCVCVNNLTLASGLVREEVWVPDLQVSILGTWNVDLALRSSVHFLGAQLHSCWHHGYIICPFRLILLILD